MAPRRRAPRSPYDQGPARTDIAKSRGRAAYDADSVQYAEFMLTFSEGEDRRRLAQAIGSETDPAAMLAALERSVLDKLVAARAR